MSRFMDPKQPSGAYISLDDRYRYTLWRWWNGFLYPDLEHMVCFIGLNPSTADETKDDATVRRLIQFAKHWDFQGMILVNLFAYRSTSPQLLKRAKRPVGGQENMAAILFAAEQADHVVCCWGNHGKFMDRSRYIYDFLYWGKGINLDVFKITKQGEPYHPLYLPTRTDTFAWERQS